MSNDSRYPSKKLVEFEDRFKEGKRVLNLQELFDGVKIEVMKPYETFQLQHAFKMGGHYEMGPQKQKAKEAARLHGGSKDQYLYELSATYVHLATKILLMGRIDTHDRMMGRFHHPINNWLTYKLMGQTIEEHSAGIAEATIRPADETVISLKTVNLQQHTAGYMQKILPTLVMGTELNYNSKNGWIQSDFTIRYQPFLTPYHLLMGFPGQEINPTLQPVELLVATLFTAKSKKVVGASAEDSDQWSIPYSIYRNIGGFSVGYFKRMTMRICFASSVKFEKINPGKWDSSLRIGMDYLFPLFSYRAQINSKGTVSSYYEDAIEQFKLSFSGKINYFKSIYKFGFGVTHHG